MFNIKCCPLWGRLFTMPWKLGEESAQMQGMASKISENPNLWFGKVVEILHSHIGVCDWYLQGTARIKFAAGKVWSTKRGRQVKHAILYAGQIRVKAGKIMRRTGKPSWGKRCRYNDVKMMTHPDIDEDSKKDKGGWYVGGRRAVNDHERRSHNPRDERQSNTGWMYPGDGTINMDEE